MKFKLGISILQVWCVLNILPGIGSLIYIAMGYNAPAFSMLFSSPEIADLNQRVLATGNGLAILLNAMIISFCIMTFYQIVLLKKSRSKSSFLVLMGSIVLLQVAGYFSDMQFLFKNLIILNISSAVLLIGFRLAGKSLLPFYTHSHEKNPHTGN